jgi:hypothetical protein
LRALAVVVGVPSSEQPSLKLVDPGKRINLMRKIRGAEGIAGKSMPPGAQGNR